MAHFRCSFNSRRGAICHLVSKTRCLYPSLTLVPHSHAISTVWASSNDHVSLSFSIRTYKRSLHQRLFSLLHRPFSTSAAISCSNIHDGKHETKVSTGNKEIESRLISKAKLVLNENLKRREKIANAVANFAQEYSTSIIADRQKFLLDLVDDFGVSREDISSNANSFLNFLLTEEANVNDSVSQRKLIRQLEKLRQSLVPFYDQLFVGIGALENGIKLIVDIRADLLDLIASASISSDDARIIRLRDLDRSLKKLLSSWFSVGLLKLETVDWQSPCDLLQKVSEFERVHPVKSWTDLKYRVGPYRRCFIFTHSSMPREPVMVLHTFLADSISKSIHDILPYPRRPLVPEHAALAATPPPDQDALPITKTDEKLANIQAAIFYSINNTQKGLRGVDLGHYLIKNAVKELNSEFPHLNVFSTLSPIPGFKDWVMKKLAREVKYYRAQVPGGTKVDSEDVSPNRLFLPSEVRPMMNQLMSVGFSEESYLMMLFMHKLHVFVSTNKWYQNPPLVQVLETPLIRLCVRYLYVEKHRGNALNPVANFHLRNGATLWRVNWLADISPKGLEESFGLMVNFRYYPGRTEENNQKYEEEKFIDISEDVLNKNTSSS